MRLINIQSGVIFRLNNELFCKILVFLHLICLFHLIQIKFSVYLIVVKF